MKAELEGSENRPKEGVWMAARTKRQRVTRHVPPSVYDLLFLQ